MARGDSNHDLASIVDEHMPQSDPFAEVYKDIHQNPDLGEHESRTAKIASNHLGFKVIEYIVAMGPSAF